MLRLVHSLESGKVIGYRILSNVGITGLKKYRQLSLNRLPDVGSEHPKLPRIKH
jgi:hypothetical protein